ncbi:MAG: hypothetical protein MK125_09465 [Dehalococcoidia bacterium]|nr:hypothetical protein [Dehalococcoidia bacterium]
MDELIEMAIVANQYGGYYGTHVGSEGFDIETELDKPSRSPALRGSRSISTT